VAFQIGEFPFGMDEVEGVLVVDLIGFGGVGVVEFLLMKAGWGVVEGNAKRPRIES
jgi:hypothetical protein